MTRDDISQMWLQSQDDAEGMRLGFTTQHHYFAALVAAAEREACAKVCEELQIAVVGNSSATANQCAAAIRARNKE